MYRKYLSASQQVFFFKRLALYSNSGISLLLAFAALEENLPTKHSRKLAATCGAKLAQGIPLSETLLQFPNTFDQLTLGLIKAGEASGSLSNTFTTISNLLNKRNAWRQRIISSLIYPAILCVATLGIISFLIFYIFPKILPLFIGLHTPLPLPTRILITGSAFLTEYWIAICACCIVFVFLLYICTKSQKICLFVERCVLLVPLLSRVYRTQQQARVFIALPELYDAGIQLLETFDLVSSSITSLVYAETLRKIRERIRIGDRPSQGFRAVPHLFSPIIWQMFAIGEETGSLRECLHTIAAICAADSEELAKRLTTFIEPAVMIFMGLAIGFVALALITPIYGLTSAVSSI